MWDLSSPTRDRICTCCIARWIPNHCTLREAPVLCFEYVRVHGPGGGNGNPLQQWCLGNPMDRGAWRAIVHGVAKSWTWLKWLSTHRCMHMCVCEYASVWGAECVSVCVCACVFLNVCVLCEYIGVCTYVFICVMCISVCVCVCVCAHYYFWCDLLLMNGIWQIWQDTTSKFNLPRLLTSALLSRPLGLPVSCFDETSYHKGGTHMERNWGHSLWRTRSCQHHVNELGGRSFPN